jgi:ribosome-associated protein
MNRQSNRQSVQLDAEHVKNIVVDALEDVKGQDIVVFTVHPELGASALFDYVVIASGTSNRQCRALAQSVLQKVKESGGDVLGIEGEKTSDWVLVDCGSVVVHVMHPDARAYYRLEEIWGGYAVRSSPQ